MASERRESIPVLEFFNPEFLFEIENDGIDGILRGLALDPAQNIDRFVGLCVLSLGCNNPSTPKLKKYILNLLTLPLPSSKKYILNLSLLILRSESTFSQLFKDK